MRSQKTVSIWLVTENSNNDLSTSVVAPETEGRPKGQHNASHGSPRRSWSNEELTEALQLVWKKKMTTSQASIIFGIPYKTLIVYVSGKYGKSLKLAQLKRDCIGGPLDALNMNSGDNIINHPSIKHQQDKEEKHQNPVSVEIKNGVESAAQKSEKQTENEKDTKATKDKRKTTKSTPTDLVIVSIGSDSSESLASKQCELVDKPTSIRAHVKAVHPKTPGDIHKCHIGDEEFPSKRLQSAHSTQHLADNKFECYVCGKTFTKLVDLRIHFNEHLKQKLFRCDYCNKEFMHKKSLSYHILIHMGSRVRLVCDLCGAQYCDKTQFRIHTDSVHKKLMPYCCQVCGVWFATKRRLKYHEMRHTSDKSYTCEVCAKHFPGLPHLKDHQKRQHEHAATMKIYTCPHCEAKFESKGRYLSHRRSFVHLHFNKKIVDMNLKCEYCGRIFEKKYAYNRHMDLHLKSPSFSCEICDKKFTDKNTVVRHMNRHNPPGDKQTCTLCRRKVRNMEKHMRAHTEKAYECQYCNKRYLENNTLTQHIKTKHLNIRHVCPLCPAKFTSPGGLKKHNRKVHNGVEAKPPPVVVDLEQIRTFRIEKA